MMDNEGESNGLYSLAFVVAAFGAFILIGSFTGNVVGLGEKAPVIGSVLVSSGIVGALILSRTRKATF